MITDLTAKYDTLEIEGLVNCEAHSGMIQTAKYVQSTLDRLNILQQAFDRAQVIIFFQLIMQLLY